MQAKIPFDEEELRYISGLDADSDVQFLRQELPWLPEGSLRTLQVSRICSESSSQSWLNQKIEARRLSIRYFS